MVQSRPLFAAKCKHALCILGNRPSNAQYFLEPTDVQYLLQEMAFKTKSRKRTKSSTNLLEGKKSNTEHGDQDEGKLENSPSKKTPPRRGRMDNRIFSQMNLLQPRIITDKEAQYHPDEVIPETREEDNLT